MPNKCSAPGCKGNYSSTDCYVSVFKLPTDPELRHKWIRALHLVDINQYTYACEKHFRDEDIARSYSVPSGTNGTLKKFLAKYQCFAKAPFLVFCLAVLSIFQSLNHLCHVND